MGRLIPFILVLLNVTGFAIAEPPAATQPAPDRLNIRIAVPERESPSPVNLHVVFENTSKVPIAILDEWNSFGHYNIALDFTMSDGHHILARKAAVGWERNFPTATTLQPGQVLVRDVYFDPQIWKDLPVVEFETALKVQAFFTQSKLEPLTESWIEMSKALWTGKIESNTMEIVYRPRAKQ